MIKGHIIKLNPTIAQERFFRKSCGVARFAYNWALNKWQEDYKNGIKQSAYSLVKHLNSIKATEFPWMQETGKCAPQYAIHHLQSAYNKMWKKGAGYPKFKKKGRRDSFVSLENEQQFKQKDNKIWIPRLGWVRCHEYLRFKGKVNHVIVKRIADMWFAVVNIKVEVKAIEAPAQGENQACVGVDMGIKSMMILSDGTIFENPRALKSNLKRLKQRQRSLSRKAKGSNNRKRQQIKVARTHYRVSNIRKNAIHQATIAIVKKYDKIVIETLNVKGMVKNRKLSQALSDVSFGEIANQLEYKCGWYGKELVKADTWFASSKTCSCCGHKKSELKLSERTFNCQNCGLVIDRDLNAAINLANYSPTPKSGESYASGFGSSLVEIQDSLKTKEEIINSYGLEK